MTPDPFSSSQESLYQSATSDKMGSNSNHHQYHQTNTPPTAPPHQQQHKINTAPSKSPLDLVQAMRQATLQEFELKRDLLETSVSPLPLYKDQEPLPASEKIRRPSQPTDPPPADLLTLSSQETPPLLETERPSITLPDMQRMLERMNLGQVWQWIYCIGTVNFDLDIGQDLEFMYPPLDFSDEEKKFL